MNGTNKIDPDQLEMFLALTSASKVVIAKHFGVSPSAVTQRMDILGFERWFKPSRCNLCGNRRNRAPRK